MYDLGTDLPKFPGDGLIESLRSRLGYFAIDEVHSGNAFYLMPMQPFKLRKANDRVGAIGIFQLLDFVRGEFD